MPWFSCGVDYSPVKPRTKLQQLENACYCTLWLATTTIRAAFRILLKGGKIAVSAYRGGQALHAVHYNIYSKISKGGKHPAGGGGGQMHPPPPKKNPLSIGLTVSSQDFFFTSKVHFTFFNISSFHYL